MPIWLVGNASDALCVTFRINLVVIIQVPKFCVIVMKV
jgi:hypothetical protein